MAFFQSAVGVLQTLVIALGAGLAVWGGINLMEGYGQDNPGAKSQGIQYTENGSVFFTEQMLQEYMARSVHRARPIETRYTYRNPRNKPRY